MSIEKMEFLTIVGVMKDLDRVLEKCVESGCFHMTDASRKPPETMKNLFVLMKKIHIRICLKE